MWVREGLDAAREAITRDSIFTGRRVGCAILCTEWDHSQVYVVGTNYTEEGPYRGDYRRKDRYAYTPHAEIDCLTKIVKRGLTPSDPFILYLTASPCLKCVIMAHRMGVKAIVVAKGDPFDPNEYMIREAFDFAEKNRLPILREQGDDVPRI